MASAWHQVFGLAARVAGVGFVCGRDWMVCFFESRPGVRYELRGQTDFRQLATSDSAAALEQFCDDIDRRPEAVAQEVELCRPGGTGPGLVVELWGRRIDDGYVVLGRAADGASRLQTSGDCAHCQVHRRATELAEELELAVLRLPAGNPRLGAEPRERIQAAASSAAELVSQLRDPFHRPKSVAAATHGFIELLLRLPAELTAADRAGVEDLLRRASALCELLTELQRPPDPGRPPGSGALR